MQQSFKNVNHARVMWLFRDVFAKKESYGAFIKVGERDMDVRVQFSSGTEGEEAA